MKPIEQINTYKNILTIVVGFTAIFFIFDVAWALYVGLAVGVLAILHRSLAESINKLWNGIGWVLSFIVPNILLTFIFYLFLTPIALMFRLFNKNDQLKLKNKYATTFTETNQKFSPSSFEKPW